MVNCMLYEFYLIKIFFLKDSHIKSLRIIMSSLSIPTIHTLVQVYYIVFEPSLPSTSFLTNPTCPISTHLPYHPVYSYIYSCNQWCYCSRASSGSLLPIKSREIFCLESIALSRIFHFSELRNGETTTYHDSVAKNWIM